jgi:hypothetical protein
MKQRLRPRLSYANVIASLALFVALSGVAVAAGLPKHSVGAKQLKKGAVTTAAIKNGAVTAGKLGPKSVVAGKLGPNAVGPGNIGNGAVTSDKIVAGAVIASSIKNGVITTNKLTNANVTTPKIADANVTTAKLANGAVTAAKLAPEVLNTVQTLKSGQTLRGVFDVGGTATEASPVALANGSITFQQALAAAPTVTVVKKGTTTANCPGLGGGNEQTPGATAGNLCIYLTAEGNLNATGALTAEFNTRLGVGLVAKSAAKGDFSAVGQWAVTAP